MLFFAEVAERGGFAAAGRALGLPTSRLSRRVAELEGRLGVRLLQRTTRRVALTDVGAQYLLASMHETGDGVPADRQAARRWYEAAARNGDPAAPLKLRELAAGDGPATPTARP